MKFKTLFLIVILFSAFSCKNTTENTQEADEQKTTSKATPSIDIQPISHATMVLDWEETVFYVDPVGGAEAFKGKKEAHIILVTHVHGDHLNIETLEAVVSESSIIIAPPSVAERLSENLLSKTIVLANDETTNQLEFDITGVPMYNLREEALNFHEKGRGNGYLIEKDGYRVYISGDTEDIPEMRDLEGIDLAFICMNLPYTMTVGSAASAVAEFMPKTVIPYHFRGKDGFADVDAFERLVNENAPDVEVKRLDFYPVE
ncbi:MAG: MBL fold metallo-hydrolase [Flavobacteriaceae bacterium]